MSHNRPDFADGQVWVYDDEIVIGPQSFVRDPFDGDNWINLWDELLQVNVSVVKKATKVQIILPPSTWKAIQTWTENGFSSLALSEYLNRMLSRQYGLLAQQSTSKDQE